jgi:hypothetical protein
MAFVQIIDMHTSRFEELTALEEEWRAATEGKRTLRRSMLARDRHDPQHYVILAFFDSYESAMTNSSLPETSDFGAKQGALVDGPIGFSDLDILQDQS